jgi:hypothetical protein
MFLLLLAIEEQMKAVYLAAFPYTERSEVRK